MYFQLHSFGFRHQLGRVIVLLAILQIFFSNLRHDGVLRVARDHQRQNGQNYFGNCQGGRPVLFEYFQTYNAFGGDVAVVNFCYKPVFIS